MGKAVLHEKSVCVLEVPDKQAYNEGATVADVGKEPSPQHAEVCRGNCASAYFPGEDRNCFYYPLAVKCRVWPQDQPTLGLPTHSRFLRGSA